MDYPSRGDEQPFAYITFDRNMAPILPIILPNFEDVRICSASDFLNEANSFDSASSLNDWSKEAYWTSTPLVLDTQPPPLTKNNVAIKDDSKTVHITRPRNAFMIYRSECLANNKINRNVEHDNRHISRIIGHCWQKLSKEEKAQWQEKADAEKLAHKDKYPNYKFSPVPRSKKPLKRNSKRNGEKDMERCRQVADLLLSGKEGDELAAAIKEIDLEKADEDDQQGPEPSVSSQSRTNESPPAFLNPLRPPRAGPSADSQAVDVSYDCYPNARREAIQRAPHQFYPSPPVSPTSPDFSFAQNRSSSPYHLRPAHFPPAPSPSQSTRTYTRIYPSTPVYPSTPLSPYQTNVQFNPFPTNEQQVGYLPQRNGPFVDIRQPYTFQSPSSSSAYPASPRTPRDNIFQNPRF